MAKKTLPTPELLRQLVEYDPDRGLFWWKPRTPDHFQGAAYPMRACSVWNALYAGKPAFITDNGLGYQRGRVMHFGALVAHRVAWAVHYDEWPTRFIDHINGDRADNRIANLRLATRSENNRNRLEGKNNTSGVMGVHWDGHSWVARCGADGIRHHLGSFATLDLAAAARQEAVDRLHREFARVHDPVHDR